MHEYFFTQIGICRGKMLFPILFLLVAGCKPSTPLGVHSRDTAGFRSQSDSPFLHRIGDWFRHLKEQVCETLFGPSKTETPPPSRENLDFDKFVLENRIRNREEFQTDLTKFSIDPEHDWGFRAGNWYFIRKGNNNSDLNNDIVEDKQSTTEVQEQSSETTEDSFDIEEKGPVTTESPSIVTNAGTTQIMMQSTTNLEDNIQSTMQTSTQIDSREGYTTMTQKRIEDNETDGDIIRKGSVEVLMG